MSFDPVESGKAGRARMKILASAMRTAIEINSKSFLAVLGREPTAQETAQAEMLASLLYRAAKLRDAGRSDVDILRQAAELMRDVPFLSSRPRPVATERPAPSPAEIQHGKAVADAVDEHNRQHRVAALHGRSDAE